MISQVDLGVHSIEGGFARPSFPLLLRPTRGGPAPRFLLLAALGSLHPSPPFRTPGLVYRNSVYRNPEPAKSEARADAACIS